MIGTIDPSRRKVHVVGAGIAGLLIADRLDRDGYEVYLHEADTRAGGLIQTTHTPFGIAEAAAHSLLVTDSAESLFQRIQMECVPVQNKSRYIYRNGKLRKNPLRAFEWISAFFRAYFVLSTARIASGEATLEEWGSRMIGNGALRFLLQPFLRGIYGAQPEELTLGAAFPGLQVPRGHSLLSFMLFKKLRSPKKRRPTMMAPRLGMGDLTRRLSESLHQRLGSRFKLHDPITDLTAFQDSNLVLCTAAQVAARLLGGNLGEHLLKIKYTPLVSVTVFIEQSAFVKDAPQGVGVLIPKEEKRRALGVLFNSSSFEARTSNPGLVSMTVILGGSLDARIHEKSDEEIKLIVNEELRVLFQTGRLPVLHVIHRWPRAVPKYNGELVDIWNILKANLKPGQVLFGNYTGQVSLRGMIETVSKPHFTSTVS